MIYIQFIPVPNSFSFLCQPICIALELFPVLPAYDCSGGANISRAILVTEWTRWCRFGYPEGMCLLIRDVFVQAMYASMLIFLVFLDWQGAGWPCSCQLCYNKERSSGHLGSGKCYFFLIISYKRIIICTFSHWEYEFQVIKDACQGSEFGKTISLYVLEALVCIDHERYFLSQLQSRGFIRSCLGSISNISHQVCFLLITDCVMYCKIFIVSSLT